MCSTNATHGVGNILVQISWQRWDNRSTNWASAPDDAKKGCFVTTVSSPPGCFCACWNATVFLSTHKCDEKKQNNSTQRFFPIGPGGWMPINKHRQFVRYGTVSWQLTNLESWCESFTFLKHHQLINGAEILGESWNRGSWALKPWSEMDGSKGLEWS